MAAAAASPAAPPQPLIGRGEVIHTRLRPLWRRFRYPTFFLLLPMRSLRRHGAGALPRNRWGWVSFFDADHGDGRADALAWLDELLEREGLASACDGEAWLHCFPRVLGHSFKPVSFWYCHRADGALVAVVAEVNNTFGERHCYLLHQADHQPLRWGQTLHAHKVFHVSPFCKVEGRYRFRFVLHSDGPTPRTVVRIDHDDANGPLLNTSVSGRLEPLGAANLRRAAWAMPLLTLGVVARIHWQALRLALAGVPFFRKPTPPAQATSHGSATLS